MTPRTVPQVPAINLKGASREGQAFLPILEDLRRDLQREGNRREAQERLILELRQDLECERKDRELLGQRVSEDRHMICSKLQALNPVLHRLFSLVVDQHQYQLGVDVSVLSARQGIDAWLASTPGSASPQVPHLEDGDACRAAALGAGSLKDLEARVQALDKRLHEDVLPAVEALCANNDQETASRRSIVEFVNKLSQDLCRSRVESRGREQALEQAIEQDVLPAVEALEQVIGKRLTDEALEQAIGKRLSEAAGGDASVIRTPRTGSSSSGNSAFEVDLDARLMELAVAQGALREEFAGQQANTPRMQKAACVGDRGGDLEGPRLQNRRDHAGCVRSQ